MRKIFLVEDGDAAGDGIKDIIKEQAADAKKCRSSREEYNMEDRNRLFNDMVGEDSSPRQLLEQGKKLGLELDVLSCSILLLKLEPARQQPFEVGQAADITPELESLFEGREEIIKFYLPQKILALLIKGNSIEEVLNTQEACIDYVKKLMERSKGSSYFGGAGRPVGTILELPDAFREASRAFVYRYILDTSEILRFSDVSGDNAVIPGFGFETGSIMQLNKRKVENFLENCNKEEIGYFVEEYLRSISNDSRNSLLFRQYIIVDMYCIVASFAEELGYGKRVIDEPFEGTVQLPMINSFDFIRRYVEKIFHQVIELRDISADSAGKRG